MSVTGLVPLQYSLPANIELLVTFLVFLGIILIPTVWVYRDAKQRGMNALLWAAVVGILFLLGLLPGVLAFVVYLWKRTNDT